MRPVIRRARVLRSEMSHPEVILWSRLKRLREHGFHIRRQAPFRGYFLDFVCYARRLVIEVDGSQHSEDRQADHDLVRDAILRREGFRVLRVSAAQVRNHVTAVMDQIIAELEAAPSTRDADPDERRLAHTSPPWLACGEPVPPH